MLVELELCGPKGDGQVILWQRVLEIVQRDNEMLFQAMLRANKPIPQYIDELGLPYMPPSREEARGERQRISGLRGILERQSWSCGDAAALEAAAMVVLHGVPAVVRAVLLTPRQSPRALLHAVYDTPAGRVDPTARWLQAQGRGHEAWEATL
jgi:hypothetical protein